MKNNVIFMIIIAALAGGAASYINSVFETVLSNFLVHFVYLATVAIAFYMSPKRRAEREAKKSDTEKQ